MHGGARGCKGVQGDIAGCTKSCVASLACCRRSDTSPLASALSLHSRSSAVSFWLVSASSFASRSRSLTDCTSPPKEATWLGLWLGLGVGLGIGVGIVLG